MPEVVQRSSDEPVTLDEAKAHLRLDGDGHDQRLASLIQAAREQAERYLGRSIGTQTLRVTFDEFDTILELPGGPVQSIEKIEYIDARDEYQELPTDSYRVIGSQDRITATNRWPRVSNTLGAVMVTYVAGYDETPEAIKQSILMMVERLFDRHEANYDDTLARVASALLWPYRSIAV